MSLSINHHSASFDRMKTVIKKIMKGFLIVIAICIFLFVAARYGWKLFGFNLCLSPNGCWVENVEFTEDDVHIQGAVADSISSVVGYVYKIKDGKLYLGVKSNMFLGFFRRYGGFDITIDTKGQEITEVYL